MKGDKLAACRYATVDLIMVKLDRRDDFPRGLVEEHVRHAGEEPVQAGAAVEIVGQAVAENRSGATHAVIQEEVYALDDVHSAGRVGQVRHAGGVVDVGAAPFRQESGQGGGVVVISRFA